MMTLFLKELRENLKWAAVIFGVLTVMVYNQIRKGDPLLLFNLAQFCTVFIAPLAGLLMGVVQSLFETRPDNWAFVVHRPLPRQKIFAAQSAAGLVLLYLSLELPCLLAAAWAARPGNLAMPFHMNMLLPTLSDTLNAGCFYFAGVILTLRRARWFGTRLLPIVLPLASTAVMCMFVPQFWQALLLILAVQCIGALAALGVFMSGGAMDHPRAPRFALGAMIFVGALAVGVCLAGPLQLFYSTNVWHLCEIDRDGRLVHVTWTWSSDKQRTSSVCDIQGNPLPEYEGVDLDDPGNFDRFVRFNTILADERAIPPPLSILYFGKGYRNISPGIVRLTAGRSPSVCLFDTRERIIDVYDPMTRLRQGTIGPAGFKAEPSAPAERFPAGFLSPQSGRTLAFASAVYWTDLAKRSVRRVFTASLDDPIFSAVELPQAGGPGILIATKRHLHLIRDSGEVVFAIPLSHDPGRHFFQAAVLPSNQHIMLSVGSIPRTKPNHVEYLELATDGRVVQRTELPPLPSDVTGAKRLETVAFAAVYPLAALPLAPAWMIDAIFDFRCEQYASLFHRVQFGSAILCALGTILMGRRCEFSTVKTFAWAAANLLLGPAGIAVMIGLNEWPVREVCLSCGSKRIVGSIKCSQCDADPPSPALDGREIFDSVEALDPAA